MIVVTGGSGFLGGALARALAARGERVRAVQRSDAPDLRNAGVEVVPADLTSPKATTQALHGAAAVLHVAALATAWGSLADYQAANVTATQNVINACRTNDIHVLVYTSTPSVVHSGQDLEGVDESVPMPPSHSSHYAATKAQAEALVLAANSPELATVALRPHAIWGPGDTTLLPRILHRARHGHLRLIEGGRKIMDAVYIDNAVEAHLCALDKLQEQGAHAACAGRVYFIANDEPKPVGELINALLAAAGLPPCKKEVSAVLAFTAAAAFEQAWTTFQLTGEPWLTKYIVEMFATSHWYNLSAARRDLGYSPSVSTVEGLQRLQQALAAKEAASDKHKPAVNNSVVGWFGWKEKQK